MRNLIRRAAVAAGAAAVLLTSGTGVAAAQPLPHLMIAPAAHTFGNVPVGGAATETFRLANTGGSATGALTVTAAPHPPFKITATTCRGALPPRQSCAVTVQFVPGEPGGVRGRLTAAGARPEARVTAELTGIGTSTAGCQVTNTATDARDDTLQAAVNAASSGADLLVRGTCGGPTTVGKTLTVTGAGPSPTLDGLSRGGTVVTGSVLTITAGVTVSVSDLTITDGRAPALGGGINNSGTLILDEGTAITGNSAPSQGGGISNTTGGTVTLNDGATIRGNTANNGGGIYNFGTVTLNSTSSINHNAASSGGGIFNIGTVTLNDHAAITGNTVTSSSGGGIFNVGTVNGNRGKVAGNKPNDIVPPSDPSPPPPDQPSPRSAGGSLTSTTGIPCSPGAPGFGFYNGNVCIGTTQLPDGRFQMTDPARPDLSCGETGPFTQRTNTWGNGEPADLTTACVDALYAAAAQWDMLRAWLGRNGFDGQGHAAAIEVGSPKCESFFFPATPESPAMVRIGVVCPGSPPEPDPQHRQRSSMDIVGHEFGHMVFDTTPGGFNMDVFENRALSEGTGDIFAQLTIAFAGNPRVPLTYTIGSQFGPPSRFMYNPALADAPNCWSPDLADVSEQEPGHASGPLNHWFYLLAEGSNPVGLPTSPTCDRSTLTGLGIQLAGKIWYDGLLLKTPTWKYADARSATLTAAKRLFPGSCTVFDKVRAAWNAVSVPARPDEPTCHA